MGEKKGNTVGEKKGRAGEKKAGTGEKKGKGGGEKTAKEKTVKEKATKEKTAEEKTGKMLDVFITSRVRRKILIVFAKYPDFKTHVRGLSKLIHEDPGNIQRELKRLERGKFLLVSRRGNTYIYQTNKQFPLLKELQSMVIKSQQYSNQSKPNKTIG